MELQVKTLREVLFLDIETVPHVATYDELNAYWQSLWDSKHATFRDAGVSTPSETYASKAGIFAEFGKIICVSIGYFHHDKKRGSDTFRVKSFSSDNEAELLAPFCALLCKYFNDVEHWQLGGHNVREFDIPYLCRRILANGLTLPAILDLSGRKPWEINVIDTLQQWRFGDFKNYTSLKLIAATLGIASPKEDIEGKDVAAVYWQGHELDRIVRYCQRDVVTVARILMRLKGETALLQDEDVVLIE